MQQSHDDEDSSFLSLPPQRTEDGRHLTFAETYELLLAARLERQGGKAHRGETKDAEWRPADCSRAVKLAEERLRMRVPVKALAGQGKSREVTEKNSNTEGNQESEDNGAARGAEAAQEELPGCTKDKTGHSDLDDNDTTTDGGLEPVDGPDERLRTPPPEEELESSPPQSPQSIEQGVGGIPRRESDQHEDTSMFSFRRGGLGNHDDASDDDEEDEELEFGGFEDHGGGYEEDFGANGYDSDNDDTRGPMSDARGQPSPVTTPRAQLPSAHSYLRLLEGVGQTSQQPPKQHLLPAKTSPDHPKLAHTEKHKNPPKHDHIPSANMDIQPPDYSTQKRRRAPSPEYNPTPPKADGFVSRFKRARLDRLASSDKAVAPDLDVPLSFLSLFTRRISSRDGTVVCHNTPLDSEHPEHCTVLISPQALPDFDMTPTWLLAEVQFDTTPPSVLVHSSSDTLSSGTRIAIAGVLSRVLHPSESTLLKSVQTEDLQLVALPIAKDDHHAEDEDEDGDQDENSAVRQDFLKCCAVNVHLNTISTAPLKAFLWAWSGALAAISTELARSSEARRAVELPHLAPLPIGTRVETRDSSKALATCVSTCHDEVAALDSHSDSTWSYRRELSEIRKCTRVALTFHSAESPPIEQQRTTTEYDKKIASTQDYLATLSDSESDEITRLEQKIKDLERDKAAARPRRDQEASYRKSSTQLLEELETWISLSQGEAEKDETVRQEYKNRVLGRVTEAVESAQRLLNVAAQSKVG
ncbi:hypothetical protein CLAFUW4_07620 [Fulvia fulva]|uniref:Uncharacterized protein n=1 Tax=Passalora fulva TaxID=5499 RepID=A0A9Q8UQV5_PASFU|nr:uncharacterized protein CLAFUR5_07750 [Fulvia fulva]KAK4609403.1 hypothetical protein CLAFUR4_14787 [Fulvia fulva]KAK4621660.1 hypothetical protein CLAFUR4_07625 [Fulvia fulva]KAK4623301.1 hypothetical protein CLAFUR0_07625 [Fulvia fulva]UJO19103.1 hypothetical protein CLAFUR5_07750 [Fulvia fulva]WPV16287.1 hypothetical protein CLAFUW4_07620 [Fulvia fulva]